MKLMKWGITGFSVLLILLGGVWILQGVGILPGSFMSGHIQWAYNGLIAALIGLGLLVATNWPWKKLPPSP